eukprot:5841909-Lingulodinium_polyedra.AAC.1
MGGIATCRRPRRRALARRLRRRSPGLSSSWPRSSSAPLRAEVACCLPRAKSWTIDGPPSVVPRLRASS